MISLHTSFLRKVLSRINRADKPFVYVAIGDSAAEGVGASCHERSYPGIIHTFLTKHYQSVTFYNFGKRRSPASWVISEQLERAIELNPDLITLSVGANDIRVGNMPWKFEKDLRVLARELRSKTSATIVINSIPDFSHVYFIPFFIRPLASRIIKKFNGVIEKVANDEGIVFVDLFHNTSIFAKYPEATAKDRFHPSDFGYALWANSILSILKLSDK